MHPYRSETCGAIRSDHVGKTVRLSGWVHRKRDHGGLLFVDLRDHYGVTQCVIEPEDASFNDVELVRNESVIMVEGKVVARSDDTVNSDLPTGEVEIRIEHFEVLSAADDLPLPVFGEQEYPEDVRLTYRYLDLRRERMHENIVLRSKIISSIRLRMTDQGFLEFQTPILTASSPEGARDFLVPSRLHPGKFYALPQAPQQYKQLIMVAGFDKYFQIAPCFRDEAPRADRVPGEFYQLDVEMSFVTQEDVFEAIEPMLAELYTEFSGERQVVRPFERIPFGECMLKYGTDQPDLRNPIVISDVTEVFSAEECEFNAFKNIVKKGGVVRGIPGPGAAAQPRSFFDKLNDWARSEMDAAGLGYIIFEEEGAKGPIAKFIPENLLKRLMEIADIKPGDALFFSCDQENRATNLAGEARTRIGDQLGLIEEGSFRFCWIVDYPMYEYDEDEKKIDFSHNPFSMPQGGLDALDNMDPLDILAFQYDLVCNGTELLSGAIRNHLPEIMYRAFAITGYSPEDVERDFGGLISAFKFGAPPHGGVGVGIDRIVMQLADEPNLREVIMFPVNQQGQDLMMGAPSEAPAIHLRELALRLIPQDPKPS